MKTLADVTRFAVASAASAIDAWGDYGSLENAIASHRENVRDTLNENGMSEFEPLAFAAFDGEVSRAQSATTAGDGARPIALRDVKKGEFFKRKPDAKKVFRAAGYCRINRAYQGDDCDDISRAVYLKGTTIVYVGFTY